MHNRFPTTKSLIDLDFYLSWSLKVKCDGAIGIPIYVLLLVFNSSIWQKLWSFMIYKPSESQWP